MLSEQDVQGFISNNMDCDRDGKVSIKEFFNYVMG
jgi:hypothetical protein